MAANIKYNLYQGDKLYLEGKTAPEISKMFGCTQTAVHSAYMHDHKLCKKYRVERVSAAKPEDTEEKPHVPDTFWMEWRKMNEMFKKVIWVEKGGKRLKVSK